MPQSTPRAGTVQQGPTDEQRRRIRRTTILLVLVALAIYVTFVASSMLGAGS